MFKVLPARRFALIAALGFFAVSAGLHAQSDNSGRGRKYKPPPPSARIEVTVIKADNGKPIENAAVIFHPIEGDKDKGALELKTNEDGKALIDVIPIGDTVRLQVIAKGFQTYGGDYKVDKDEMAMTVRLNRPGKQYSIYDNNAGSDSQPKKDDGNGDQQKNPPPDQNQQQK